MSLSLTISLSVVHSMFTKLHIELNLSSYISTSPVPSLPPGARLRITF